MGTGLHQHAGSFTGFPVLDFFTAGGAYAPRIHCLTTEAGTPDWGWVTVLIALNILVVGGYLRIFMFWRRAYAETATEDRDNKLMDLAWIFLLCGATGYLASVVMYFWPGYRLLVFFLVPLAFFTWKFAVNLDPFRTSLSAKRFKRELKESLEKRNEELERLVTERTAALEVALERADEASDAKGRFLANMSHEIRTPLNAIVGFADLLEDDRLDRPLHADHVRTIRANSAHLLSLLNDVLDMARIESGGIDVELAPTDIALELTNAARMLDSMASERGVDLEIDIDPGTPGSLLTDATRLRQVAVNLIGNAVKFTEQGGVRLAVCYREGSLRFEVIDTGPGMTEKTRAGLFVAFARGDDSNGTGGKPGGTGLGLKISHDLVRLLGGVIEVETEVGRGSTFRAVIPMAEAADAVVTPRRPAESSAALQPLAGRRILIAEDGVDNARLATFCLERAGADVVRAVHGGEAVDLIRAGERFGIVLMDMQMPVMDGYEASRELRSLGFDGPIIAVTASTLDAERRRCAEAGCDGFLSKPYRRQDLIDACVSACDAAEAA